MLKKDFLIILDLDHRLIYSSLSESEPASLLMNYNKFIKVYERPFAREFITFCKDLGDIIVYTTAEKEYAVKISKALEIDALELISREQLQGSEGNYYKDLYPEWSEVYNTIIVIDDSPNVWSEENHNQAVFMVPDEFMGEAEDVELKHIMNQIKTL